MQKLAKSVPQPCQTRKVLDENVLKKGTNKRYSAPPVSVMRAYFTVVRPDETSTTIQFTDSVSTSVDRQMKYISRVKTLS